MALLDEKSMYILKELEKNGRVPYSKLAKSLGISDTAVKKRIRALEKAGIILGYKAKINEKAIGQKCALLLLNVDPENLSLIVDHISSNESICDAFIRYGTTITLYLIVPLSEVNEVKETLSNVADNQCPTVVVERLK